MMAPGIGTNYFPPVGTNWIPAVAATVTNGARSQQVNDFSLTDGTRRSRFPAIGLSSPCSCLETPGMALH